MALLKIKDGQGNWQITPAKVIEGGGGVEVSTFTPQSDILIGKNKSNLLSAFGLSISSTQILFFYDINGYLTSSDYYWWGMISGKSFSGTNEVKGGTTWTNGASYDADDSAKLMQGRTYKIIVVSEENING